MLPRALASISAALFMMALPSLAVAEGTAMTSFCSTRPDTELAIRRQNPGTRLTWIGGGNAVSLVRVFNANAPTSDLAADGILSVEPANQPHAKLFFFRNGCMVASAELVPGWLRWAMDDGV